MKLLKPSWVTHDGHPIFSVDIHPDGTRFATGGQGADAGRIVIWNMAPVMTEDDEKNENIPKMLSQMDNHLACVNCVRWSGNGRYLASGGDDKVLMIWQQGRYGGGPTTFGSSGKLMSMEQWRCISTLRGHSGDVLDLAWSPHDVWLASCSVDNTVVIWNTSKWQEIVAVLKGHTGLVKGVSWDPVGKYVASQSDDKNLRVWRTHDWLEETVVSEPFEECGGTTHILRLSWSPDGQYLVSAHAMNNSGPTAQIIEREGWKTNKDFVGHRKAITCVKFNPNILSKLNKETGKVHHFCCCAIGSRDRSLSVWLTSLKRPLVVIHSLFSNSVLDVSWSRIGHQLLVCSWDGTVAYVEFSEEEIGKPISEDEKNQLHQRLYGKSLAMTNQLTTSSATVIENPELLKMREEQTFKTEKPKTEVIPNGVMTSQLVDSNSGSKHQDQQSNISRSGYARGPTDKQIETRMPDGRRRITPLYIPPDMGEVAPSYTSGAMPTFSSSKETKSRIVIEKRDETSNCQPNSISPRMQVSLGSVPPKQPSLNIASTNDIQPSPSAAMERVLTTVSVESDKQKEVQPLPLVDSTPIRVPTKRLAETNSGPGRPPEKRRPGRPPLHPNVQAPTMEKDCRPERQSPPGGGLHLPVLKAEKTLTAQIGSGKVDQTYTLELENNISIGAGLVIHKLKCLSQGGPVWEAVLTSRGAGIAGSRHAACVVCEDSTLSLFSSGGQRLLPPVVLSSPATRLTCSDQYVMVLTSRGCVSVWNIQELKTLVKNESLLPIMQAPAGTDLSIRSTGLTEHGAPVVSLSTKKSYIFNFDVGAWLLISSAEDAVYQCSDHQSCLPPNIKFQETLLPLASLQGELNRSPRVARNIFNSNPATRQAATLSHLDSQLAAALSMHSAKDYKFWFLTLVRYLTQEGLEPRLRDLCSELLGPVVQTTKQTSWKFYIMGLSKRELLREILPVMGSNLKLQRLVTEFKEQLDAILT